MQEIQEMQVLFLAREDPLEKGMATHSSILAQRIPQKEATSRLQSIGLQRVGHGSATEHTHKNHLSLAAGRPPPWKEDMGNWRTCPLGCWKTWRVGLSWISLPPRQQGWEEGPSSWCTSQKIENPRSWWMWNREGAMALIWTNLGLNHGSMSC